MFVYLRMCRELVLTFETLGKKKIFDSTCFIISGYFLFSPYLTCKL